MPIGSLVIARDVVLGIAKRVVAAWFCTSPVSWLGGNRQGSVAGHTVAAMFLRSGSRWNRVEEPRSKQRGFRWVSDQHSPNRNRFNSRQLQFLWLAVRDF